MQASHQASSSRFRGSVVQYRAPVLVVVLLFSAGPDLAAADDGIHTVRFTWMGNGGIHVFVDAPDASEVDMALSFRGESESETHPVDASLIATYAGGIVTGYAASAGSTSFGNVYASAGKLQISDGASSQGSHGEEFSVSFSSAGTTSMVAFANFTRASITVTVVGHAINRIDAQPIAPATILLPKDFDAMASVGASGMASLGIYGQERFQSASGLIGWFSPNGMESWSDCWFEGSGQACYSAEFGAPAIATARAATVNMEFQLDLAALESYVPIAMIGYLP